MSLQVTRWQIGGSDTRQISNTNLLVLVPLTHYNVNQFKCTLYIYAQKEMNSATKWAQQTQAYNYMISKSQD